MKRAILVLCLLVVACSPSEEHIRKEIKKANYCSDVSECVNVGGTCPFSCITYVNKVEAPRISKLISEFESDCEYDCGVCELVECDGRCIPVCD